MIQNLSPQYLGTFFFALAMVHTFSVTWIRKFSMRFLETSIQSKALHFLSEVEIVFAFWTVAFLFAWLAALGFTDIFNFFKGLSLAEPFFIFCIVVMASAKTVLQAAERFILVIANLISKKLKIDLNISQVFLLLTVAPLLGSVITEPAAMTVAALLLLKMMPTQNLDSKLIYGLLAVLFVNVSIGGALTHFAAPPILMVAKTWGWTSSDVFLNLGIAATFAVFANGILFTVYFGKAIKSQMQALEKEHQNFQGALVVLQFVLIAASVYLLHHILAVAIIFLVYVGIYSWRKNSVAELKWREGLLIASFLTSLLVLGSFQSWWLEPLIKDVGEIAIFFSAVALTSVTDNAALTFLGSQLTGLSTSVKWALVAGALVGGGATIIANAPNPIGFNFLKSKFPNEVLNSGLLLRAALMPTAIAAIIFLIFLN